ncbi:hypothetical protein J2S91_002026 [Arthrobacter bambusae]|nr:hypothetical protein [Arthrobacter bambusae]
MLDVDERVLVRTTPDGRPLGFEWRDRQYRSTETPLRFYTRRPWWVEQSRIQKGIGPQVLETETWRITASGRGRSAERVFELVRDDADWVLARILG